MEIPTVIDYSACLACSFIAGPPGFYQVLPWPWFCSYSRQTLLGLRRVPRSLTDAFIDKIADCDLLRYHGSRAGRLTRAWRARRVDVSSSTAVADDGCASLVPHPGRLDAVVTRPSASPLPPPVLYVLNAASLAKPHAIEQLTTELTGCSVGVAVVSETHLKKKHADSVVHIVDYTLFRRDRPGRKGGGVAIYTHRTLTACEWQPIPGLDSLRCCGSELFRTVA